MKTFKKIFVAVFFITLVKNSSAQASMDMFALIPQTQNQNNGFGYGINVLSNPIQFADTAKSNRFNMRMGLGFYSSGLSSATVNNVPLSNSSSLSTVTVKNSTYGVNFITRFSPNWSKKIMPYADVFAGVRGFSGDLTIIPNNYYNRRTQQNVFSSAQFNYGISGGIMASLGKNIKADVGFMYSTSESPVKMLNVSTAHVESNQLVIDRTNAPGGMFMLKFGLTFLIKGGHNYSSGSYHRYSNNSNSYYHSYSRYSGGGGRCGGGGGSHVNVSIR